VSGVPRGTAVLVTGASGFLGSHVARSMAGKGFRVRAMARCPGDIQRLGELGVEVVPGDLEDVPSLATAVAGQQLVVHTAGRVSDWGPREEFWSANVRGTASLISACQSAGVERLVHLSSLTVLGLPRDGRVVDESAPVAVPARGDHYSESKAAGERLVMDAHGRCGLATTVIRPGAIWGPGDPSVVPRIVTLLRRGIMPAIEQGGNLLGLSHVENLAEGVVLVVGTPAASGQLYHLTDGEEITARQAIDALAEVIGVRPPRVSLPYWAVHSLAAVVEGAARLLGRASPPFLTRYGVRFVACNCRYDITKARRELGYRPLVSFRQGITRLGLSASGAIG